MAGILAISLSLKHLRLIASIAEHRQISLAAAALSITQPAASRILAKAEAHIGAPLFERHPKGMALTAIGESMARRARNIVDELSDATSEVERLRLGQGGIVRVGAVTGAAVGYVAPAIRHLRSIAPDIEIHVDVGPSDDLMTGLLGLRYDLVLGRVPPGAPIADLALKPAKGEAVCILAHATHPLGQRSSIGLADLIAQNWVMQGPGSPIRRAVEEGFLAEGLALPRSITNTSSLVMVLALLQSPDVITPVSHEVASLLAKSHQGLVTLPLQASINVSPYSLIILGNRRLSPAAARFHALLANLVASG